MNLIEQWKTRSKEEGIQNKKYLSRIAKVKNKRLNSIADNLHLEVFNELDCLECANCCKSIPPIINELDVKRAAKFLGLKPSEFKDKYILVDEDQDMVINESPCPFLENDNKCAIYEGRPRACREYPHTDNFEFIKNIRLHKINMEYCPAVFHILQRMQNHQ